MLIRLIQKYPVSSFFILTLLWSDGIWCLLIPEVQQSLGIQLAPTLAWLGLAGPGLIAIVISYLLGGTGELKTLFSPLLKWRANVNYYAFIYLGVFFFYCSASWFSLIVSPNTDIPSWNSIITTRTGPFSELTGIGMLLEITLIYTFCEELGWRGFALPKMTQQMHCIQAVFIISVVWTLWHVPLVYLNGSYFTPTSFAFYYIHILCMTIIYAWLYFKTNGSLLLVGLLHGTTNGLGGLFPLTSATVGQGANGPTLIMEVMVAVLMLSYLWKLKLTK